MRSNIITTDLIKLCTQTNTYILRLYYDIYKTYRTDFPLSVFSMIVIVYVITYIIISQLTEGTAKILSSTLLSHWLKSIAVWSERAALTPTALTIFPPHTLSQWTGKFNLSLTTRDSTFVRVLFFQWNARICNALTSKVGSNRPRARTRRGYRFLVLRISVAT